MDKSPAWLKKTLDYTFFDERLLTRALTHRSAGGDNNERLEFLGDSVLQLVVSELVYAERPGASEGRLSRLRSSLVKDATLSQIASELGIGDHLILGSGERKSGGQRRASILADTLEAIFGAVYLDAGLNAGLEAARQLIHAAYGERIRDLPEGEDLRDPKSRLQEYLQGRGQAVPEYAMEKVSGKAHQQSFEVSCGIAESELKTRGTGSTRRDAEQNAALAMLERIEAQA